TDDDDVVGFAGAQILDEVGSGSPGLKLGIGTRAYFASIEDSDIGAVTLGALLRYSPPSIDRLAFTANIFHAPKIVAFLDAEKFTAFSAAIEYDLFPQATVYVGYRKVKAYVKENVKNSKRDYVEIDASAHLGVRISF
ncbi:MAG: hypothetical protein GXP10_11050, partial [Gammaproteobacteria bacterium]|nr:hypothetical protein [Gammaproteobacteria bacterium]